MMTHSFLLNSCLFFGCNIYQLVAAHSRMARAPCESEMANSVGRRGHNISNIILIDVCILLGLMRILYAVAVEIRYTLSDVLCIALCIFPGCVQPVIVYLFAYLEMNEFSTGNIYQDIYFYVFYIYIYF